LLIKKLIILKGLDIINSNNLTSSIKNNIIICDEYSSSNNVIVDINYHLNYQDDSFRINMKQFYLLLIESILEDEFKNINFLTIKKDNTFTSHSHFYLKYLFEYDKNNSYNILKQILTNSDIFQKRNILIQLLHQLEIFNHYENPSLLIKYECIEEKYVANLLFNIIRLNYLKNETYL
jgi:hypothetical protein